MTLPRFVLVFAAAVAAAVAVPAFAGQLHASMQTQNSAAPGLYAEQVQVPARSRTLPPFTLERVADFEARVLCYRVVGSQTLSCVPFSQVNGQLINEMYQRAAESQR